jgi:hypothetical protein
VKYSKHDFFDLMARIDEQDGEHLDEQCQMRTYEFCGDLLPERLQTMPGCGESALFMVPYVGITGSTDNGPVKVCAVDDDMGRWPRFGGDRFGAV